MEKIALNLDDWKDQIAKHGTEGLTKLYEHLHNLILEGEMQEHLAAGPYERSKDRRGYRNGYRKRGLTTRLGRLQLRVPQSRDGAFSTVLFERYQRSEKALLASMMEMVLQGVSTRKVEKVVKELCGKTFSKSTISRLWKQLDPMVEAFRTRSLEGTAYPFVVVDAMVVKVRQDGAVLPMSVLIAVGISAAGVREILGFAVGDSESQHSWSTLFLSLIHI